MFRPLLAALAAVLTILGLVAVPAASARTVSSPSGASGAAAAAAQVLTWTGGNSTTEYTSAPTTAVAGATTIVFDNSVEAGNTTDMPHTLTFDTSTPGYNHDVTLDILANPQDDNGGRHEAEVTLTPGKYRYFCAIPGHGQMSGEFTVTDDGGEDTTPPTVSAAVTGDQDADGNYLGSATVGVTATDSGSGVDTVEYQLDGGEWTPYTAPVVVDALGEHTVGYRATDVAGNASEPGTTSFTVVEDDGGGDTTPPAATAALSGRQDADGNYLDSVVVSVSASDEGSGVAKVEYEVDDTGFQVYSSPFAVTELGDHAVQYRATDVAGNVSETGSVPFRIVEDPANDTTPPTVAAEVTGQQDDQGNYVDVATVTISAEDTGSGVASVEYQLDGGEWTPYTDPVRLNTSGEHMLHYRATDVTGNTSAEGMVHLTIVEQDTTAPSVSASVVGERDEEGNYLGSAVVSVTADDDESGVDLVEYQLDGGEWTVYSEAVQVSAPGAHTFAYRASDIAGNVSEAGSESFTVIEPPVEDTTPPSVSAFVTGNQDANWNFIDSATLNMSALDSHSGVASVEYKLDDGDWTVYTEPVTIGDAGRHTVWYRATDNAGNVSPELSGSFTIVDGPAPDLCANSDTRSTVIIGDDDTGVTNVDTGDGCTINDLIDENGDYATHRAFVRHVREVTDRLTDEEILTRQEANRIVRAANRSDVGR